MQLVFEEIIERLPCARRFGGRWCGGFFLRRDPDGVKGALVLDVFARNALGYSLHALKAAGRIEIHALLAGMQLEAALRALVRNLAG